MNNAYGALLFLLLAGLLLGGIGAAWFAASRAARRRRLRSLRLTSAQERQLLEGTDWYRCLSKEEQTRLHGRIHVFLSEKQFIGCNGFEVTDEVSLLIAANACLLLVNRDDVTYPGLHSILVYPDSFVARYDHHDEWITHEVEEARAGEAWDGGPVILAWQEYLDGRRTGEHNVIWHEFAHQLDDANPAGEGLPLLDTPDQRSRWARTMQREFDQLRMRAESGQETLIDPYGAESPAEFFAVLSETFFLFPTGLSEYHPELYGVLSEFYRQDPAGWNLSGGGRHD